MSIVPFADITYLEEDKRITAIGQLASVKIVGFITDDEPGKADRYIEKLQTRFPGLQVLSRTNGPVPGTVTIKIGPAGSKISD